MWSKEDFKEKIVPELRDDLNNPDNLKCSCPSSFASKPEIQFSY